MNTILIIILICGFIFIGYIMKLKIEKDLINESYVRSTGLVDKIEFLKKECNRINRECVEFMIPEATEATKKAKVKMLNQRDKDRYNGIDPDRFNEYGVM